jgi:hypothetical protein
MRLSINNAAVAGPALFLLLGLFMLRQTRDAPIGDFGNYYYASRFFLESRFGPEIYEPYAFNLMVEEASSEPLYLNYAPVPPLSVPAYIPLAVVNDIRTAKLLFGLCSLLFFIWAFGRLIKCLGMERERFLLFVPLACLFPLWNNFLQGQSYLLLLGFLMEGYRQWSAGRSGIASLLWATAIALKLFPVILLLFLLIEKDWKTLLPTSFFTLLLSLSPLLLLPPEITIDYFAHIAPRLFQGEINDPFAVLYQSARVLIHKALVFDGHLNPYPWADRPELAVWLHLFFQFAVLLLLLALLRIRRLDGFSRMALSILGGLLLTGYGSSYSLLLLLLPAVALPGWLPDKTLRYAALGLLVFAVNVPVHHLHHWPLWAQFPRLYALLGLMLFSAISMRSVWPGKWAAVLIVLIICKGLWIDRPLSTEGAYYLPDGRFGIIYDYRPEEGGLLLFHFNENGRGQTLIEITDTLWNDPGLETAENQVFLDGKQITFSKSRKRRSLRLNENEILYLTDEGRGVGFYTLRRVGVN